MKIKSFSVGVFFDGETHGHFWNMKIKSFSVGVFFFDGGLRGHIRHFGMSKSSHFV
jgi:hypothetical protein